MKQSDDREVAFDFDYATHLFRQLSKSHHKGKRQIIGRIAEVKVVCDNRTEKGCEGATKREKD